MAVEISLNDTEETNEIVEFTRLMAGVLLENLLSC